MYPLQYVPPSISTQCATGILICIDVESLKIRYQKKKKKISNVAFLYEPSFLGFSKISKFHFLLDGLFEQALVLYAHPQIMLKCPLSEHPVGNLNKHLTVYLTHYNTIMYSFIRNKNPCSQNF